MASLSENPYKRAKGGLKGQKLNGLMAHEMAMKASKRKAGKTVGGPNVKRKRSKKAGATVGGPNVKRKHSPQAIKGMAKFMTEESNEKKSKRSKKASSLAL